MNQSGAVLTISALVWQTLDLHQAIHGGPFFQEQHRKTLRDAAGRQDGEVMDAV